ncbi:MAG TPA: hypothetical protein PLF81_19960 [Candidatus Anammoximicrobium sp.]|nr:hypothetical protein [Candidatus Anammoximicrobium sp.]
MLIKRVYESDPLVCPDCGGVMKVVALIEPPQGEVLEKILQHCRLLVGRGERKRRGLQSGHLAHRAVPGTCLGGRSYEARLRPHCRHG